MALTVWLILDYIIDEVSDLIIPQEKLVLFEMLKLILVDNLCYGFLVPLALLLNTRKVFPELWSDKGQAKSGFYMTEREKIPRQPTAVYTETVENQLNRKKGKLIYVESAV